MSDMLSATPDQYIVYVWIYKRYNITCISHRFIHRYKYNISIHTYIFIT